MNKEIKMTILQEGLTYEQAREELLENGVIITRPEWKGYHFRYFNHYGIRLADGEIILNPKEIYDTDKNDWMIVDLEDSEVIDTFNKLEEMGIDIYIEEDEE